MKICKNWLNEYIFLDNDIKNLSNSISYFGFEVSIYNDKFI